MIRRIAGFRQDDAGDWVAALSCLHRQHVRHRPPLSDRPWVLSAEGRADRIGTEIDCPLCDRAELPTGLRTARTAGPFDAESIPASLRHAHRVAAGTWGALRVLRGSVGFSMRTDPPLQRRIEEGQSQSIPPDVLHAVELDGPVLLALEFLVPGD